MTLCDDLETNVEKSQSSGLKNSKTIENIKKYQKMSFAQQSSTAI